MAFSVGFQNSFSSLNTIHSTRSLGFIFDEDLTYKSHCFSNFVILIFVNFANLDSIPKQIVPFQTWGQ